MIDLYRQIQEQSSPMLTYRNVDALDFKLFGQINVTLLVIGDIFNFEASNVFL